MKKQYSRLREENRRLRRENAYLRYRLGVLGEKPQRDGETPFSRSFAEISRMAAASHKRTYFGYLMGRLRESLAFRLWDRTRFAVRGVFFVSKLWSLLVWSFAILGFGTQFVLLVGALTVLIPAAAVSSVVLGFLGFFGHRKRNREIRAMLARKPQKRIFVVFVPRDWQAHSYFRAMLTSLECEGMVFLVSRSFADCGFRGFRKAGEARALVHVSYYFSLRGMLEAERVIHIY